MNRTGQYAIVESTILIGVGIAIALGFLAAFDTLSDDISFGATNTEVTLVAQLVEMNAIELMESGAEGKFTVTLPETLANKEYAVNFKQAGIEVVTGGAAHQSSLYGLPTRTAFSGHIISREPQVSLIYADNQLVLEQAQ